MIEKEFNKNSISTINFGVRLRQNEDMYFVPTDLLTKNALKIIFNDTVDLLNSIEGEWESYDVSEDYGVTRKIYLERSNDLMKILSDVYDAGSLTDLSNVAEYYGNIEFYFCEFTDSQKRRAIGVKKATRFKGTLKSRNKLVRLLDDTLTLIEGDVLRLDNIFDLIILDKYVYIVDVRSMEQIARIIALVSAAAEVKVQAIHDAIPFLDLSRIKAKISKHPRMARHATSVAANPSLSSFQRSFVELMAAKHGIKFQERDGRLQCRISDEAKLLEILDARRYHLDPTGSGGDPYRASARQKVSNAG